MHREEKFEIYALEMEQFGVQFLMKIIPLLSHFYNTQAIVE